MKNGKQEDMSRAGYTLIIFPSYDALLYGFRWEDGHVQSSTRSYSQLCCTMAATGVWSRTHVATTRVVPGRLGEFCIRPLVSTANENRPGGVESGVSH